MKSKYLFIGLIIIFLFFLYYFYITHKKLKTTTDELNTLKKYFNIEKIDNTSLVEEGECTLKTNYLNNNLQIPSNTDNQPICYKKLKQNELQEQSSNEIMQIDNQIKYEEKKPEIMCDLTNSNIIPIELNNNNNMYSDSTDIESDDDLIFNNGSNTTFYTTKKDNEAKKIISELRTELRFNSIMSETNASFTELMNNDSNPIMGPFVSCLLNNISNNISNNIPNNDNVKIEVVECSSEIELSESEKANDEGSISIHPNNGAIEEEPVTSLVVEGSRINNILDSQQHLQIEEQIENNIDENNIVINPLNMETLFPLNENTPFIEQQDNVNLTIESKDLDIKNDLLNKYKKLKLEELRLKCIEKNIKLSYNKKQKKKEELINELISLNFP